MKWENPVLIDLAHGLKALGGAFCWPVGSSADAAQDCHNGYYIFSGTCSGGGDAEACTNGAAPDEARWYCTVGAIFDLAPRIKPYV